MKNFDSKEVDMKITDTKALDELSIYRENVKAGTLKRIVNGCSFEYTPEFLAHPRYEGLSYRMKKSPTPLKIHGTNLHPFFAGLLPEGLRLKALVKGIKTSEDDLFSLFASVGSHVIGDVYAEAQAQPLALQVPKLREIDFYEYFQSVLNQNTYSGGEDALAGVQEKISASMISFPLNIAQASKSYILKLNPKDKTHLVENELNCMKLAEKCGIKTAKVKIVFDKNRNAGLLVERFDRVWIENEKNFQMLHQEDGCQILNRYPADKYKLSFNEIIEGVAEIATAPASSILKLLRLYSYSYLIGNGDLHAKNISLFTHHDHSMIDMTPAYDLISTHLYGDHKMAIKFEGKDDNLTGKMILKFELT